MRRKTEYIVIHHSATRKESDIGVETIDAWHKARGWKGIGYHWVIRRNGRIEKGRNSGTAGAHVKGYNQNSEGICLIGGLGEHNDQPEANYTLSQKTALKALIGELKSRYPDAEVVRHCDLDPKGKPHCPYASLHDLGL